MELADLGDYVKFEDYAKLESELEITNKLLDDRNAVLSKIPECPVHGFCLSHFADWIESAKRWEAENAELSAKLEIHEANKMNLGEGVEFDSAGTVCGLETGRVICNFSHAAEAESFVDLINCTKTE